MRRITKRTFLGATGALAAGGAMAQAPASVRVILTTALGAITLELSPAAPITTANFLRYVDSGHFDGANFYRASKTSDLPLSGLVQAGLRDTPDRMFPPIAHEATTQTHLTHKDGAVAMARFAPGSATSEFFICVGDQSYLDANPNMPGDNLGFAVFGEVVEGRNVARAILAAPRSPDAGDGVMKGEMLDPEVTILTARRTS